MITENNNKYVKSPSILIIDSVIEKFEISEAQFERFFGISGGTIKKVRHGERQLPSKYWHLFYDPQYKAVLRRDRQENVGARLVPEMVPKNIPNTGGLSKNIEIADDKLKGLLSK